MTTRRTKFNRRKEPHTSVVAADFPAEEARFTEQAPAHKEATAPWRLRRPWAQHVLYRLRVAAEDADRDAENAYASWEANMATMIAANENDLTPPDL